MFQAQCKIISNSRIEDKYFLMDIKAPSIAKVAMPGQFVTIRCDEAAAFLRRPFSFHRIKPAGFEILYEAIGTGTRFLANRRPGDKIDVLGPLGNGFDCAQCTTHNAQRILVAGGIGVAPLVALVGKLVHGPRSTVHREHLVLIGARTKNKILCEREFRQLGCEVKIATDNGSRGFKGEVTDLLEDILRVTSYELRVTIYTCGPEPMLKEVAHIVRKRGLECYASLEENIACGVGACLGCVVKTKSGYKMVCKDGPVFNLNEIIW